MSSGGVCWVLGGGDVGSVLKWKCFVLKNIGAQTSTNEKMFPRWKHFLFVLFLSSDVFKRKTRRCVVSCFCFISGDHLFFAGIT